MYMLKKSGSRVLYLALLASIAFMVSIPCLLAGTENSTLQGTEEKQQNVVSGGEKSDQTFDILDRFKRPDSNTVGNVEIGNTFWVERGDNETDNLIRIAGESLVFHYHISEPVHPYLACNLNDFECKDLEINVTLLPCPHSGYGRCSGISYRLDVPDGGVDEIGYHVVVNNGDSPNTISLKFGRVTIAKRNVVITSPSKIRVVAMGTSHKVYLNKNLVIDVTDSGETEDGYIKTNPGYVGLFAWYDLPAFKDFSIKRLDKQENQKP
ncbi:MAG: hypothetical protein Q7J98_03730 [Kiritimatiellia bacterium]|nr:hypothetical protein [Kiritimatiellia bacterium]